MSDTRPPYKSVNEMQPGDYVKVNGQLKKIVSVYGLDAQGRPNKPSEGGFGVHTEDGHTVSMWEAEAYHKASDVEKKESS